MKPTMRTFSNTTQLTIGTSSAVFFFHWANKTLAILFIWYAAMFNPLNIKNMQYVKRFLKYFRNVFRVL